MSCGERQSSDILDKQKQQDSIKPENCDNVNDTIYLNFHSNMNKEGFEKELSNCAKIVDGKIAIYSPRKEVQFSINPEFSNCLTAVTLETDLQFGHGEKEDKEEEAFSEFLKQQLSKKHGPLEIYEIDFEDGLDYMSDPTYELTGISINTKAKVNHGAQEKKWANKYTYKGCWNNLNKNGELYISDSNIFPDERKATEAELKAEKSKPIDILKSANYRSYINHDKSIELIYVTSHFTHQDNYDAKKINSKSIHIIIKYYSQRYWQAIVEQKKNLNQKKDLENHKRDSLLKTNLDRL